MDMIEWRQKGQPTYQRDDFRIIFAGDPDKAKEKQLMWILKQFGKTYRPKTTIGEMQWKLHDIWTDLGPSGFAEVKFDEGGNNFSIRVNCARDGWHIHLMDGYGRFDYDFKINTEIFGDVNRRSAWTQETEKVHIIMGEIYQALVKLGVVT